MALWSDRLVIRVVVEAKQRSAPPDIHGMTGIEDHADRSTQRLGPGVRAAKRMSRPIIGAHSSAHFAAACHKSGRFPFPRHRLAPMQFHPRIFNTPVVRVFPRRGETLTAFPPSIDAPKIVFEQLIVVDAPIEISGFPPAEIDQVHFCGTRPTAWRRICLSLAPYDAGHENQRHLPPRPAPRLLWRRARLGNCRWSDGRDPAANCRPIDELGQYS
jgi:hypothetical protein